MISTTNFASAWQQDNTVLSMVSNLNENKSDQTLCLHHLILARKTSLLFTYSFPLLHLNQHLHRNHQSAQALLAWINLFAAYMKCCSQKRIQASWSDARGFFFGTQLMPSQKSSTKVLPYQQLQDVLSPLELLWFHQCGIIFDNWINNYCSLG